MADKFDGYFAQRDANEAAKAGQIALQSPRTPDQALQQMDVGRELGMPAYAVGADPEFYSSLVARKRMTTALSGAPKTAQWMQNPDNADLVKDDVASIGFIESLGNSFIRWDQRTGQSFAQWQSNAARQRGADQGRSIGEIAWDERQPLRDAEGRELGREFLGVGGLASTANRFLTSRLSAALGIDEGEAAVDWQLDASEFARTAASVPMTSRAAAVRDKLGAFDASKPWQTQLVEFANLVGEDPAGFWSFLAQVGAESAPNMGVAALGMAITKSPVVAAATSGAMSGATEYGTEPLKWLEDQRINVTKPDGLAYALSQAAQVYSDGILSGVQGVINAASEAGFDLSKPEGMAELAAAIVGESGLGMDDIEGAREGVEFLKSAKLDLSTREGVLAAFSDPALMAEAERRGELRGMIIGALDGISGGVAGKALAKSPMMNLLVQGFTQSAMGAGGEALAQAAVGDEINLAEVLVEGLAEFAMAPVEVAAMGGGKAPNMIRRFTGSGKTASVLDELGQAASASKLRARSPDKFLEALNAQGLDDALISVPASAVREYFQSLGFDPQNPDLEIIEAWGVSLDGWLAAEASDGDILVPASNYAANLVGTPAADVVLRHGSLDPDAEMSLSDAELFNSEWRDVMEAELAQIEEQRRWDESLQSDSDMIRESIRSQLREAGQSQTAADAAGELWASAIVTAAERSGKSAAELWDRYQVRVVGEATAAEVRRRGALDASLNVIRSKGRKEAASPAQRAQQERKRLVEQYPELKSKRPFTKALQARGGIAPTIMRDGQEVPSPAAEALAAMGVTPKNAVGLFRKGGMTDLDNIPASEIFLSPVIGFDEATGYLQPNSIYDAIAREAAGEQVPYSAEAVAARDALAALEADVSAQGDAAAQPAGASYADRFGDTDVADLARALDAAGLDLSVMDNDAVAAALGMGDMRAANFATGQDAQGRQFDQAAPQSDAFKAWFGDSKVVDDDGKPLVVYHGTDAEFDAFDLSKAGATDAGLVGSGIYLTPDRRLAEGYGENVVEGYASIQNPMIIEDGAMPDGATLLDKHNGKLTKSGAKKLNAEIKKAGHDGVIFRAFGEISQVVAFSPEQIKSVNNSGTWDAGDPRILNQDARGRVSFPAGGIGNGQTVIDLFQKQNLSTFLHESGHVFLEIYADLARDPNAPADIKDMMGSVREWLGSEPDAEFTTDQHEKFARGFEAFLMDGKAPSLELLDAFTRFKSWLVHIYKSVKALRVNVTPKIADVMERMVATDAAIAEARQTLDVGPMFADRGPAGLSQQDWETYQKVAQRETDEASAKLLKRTMDKIRRETQAWFKEAKEQTQKDVLRDFSARRNFRLVSALSNKRWPDPANTSPVPDMQIDRAALVEIYGDGILEELGKARLGGGRAIYTRKGVSATSPQIVAEMFGYRSVMEMVEELQNTPKFNDAVRAEVDRRLVEEHGDPLSDGTIEDLAIAALHNEAKGQRDMIELRSMARRLGRVDPRQRQIKARAKMLHGALSVREASNPNAFLRAERKAAREAQASFAAVVRGGAGARESLEAAYAAKEREVLNSYLYQEARAFDKTLRSARDRFRGYSSGRVRQAIGSPHIEQIDALLEGYDFKTKTQKAVNRQESLKRYIDAMMAAGREAELTLDPEVMARADDIHYSRMKVSEFYGLNDMVRNIEHLGRLKGKLLTKQRERSEAAVVDAIRVELANMKGKPRSREKDAKFSRSRLGRAVLNWTLNADTLLREIDGFKHMGAAWDGIKRGIDEGLSRLTQRKTIMAQRFDEIFSVYTDAEKRDMATKRPNGVLGGDFSKWAIITIALNTGNRDNFQRLTNEKVNGSFTEAQVNQALSALDERDWRFVQSLIDYINEFWPDIAAKEKRVTGVSPKKVEAEVMTTAAPSWFTGGYYPIKYDGELSARADDLTQAQMADALRGGRSGKAQTAKGHTKERLTSATQPINLDIGLSMQHVNDVLYDLELGEDVAASWRILAKLKDDFWAKGKHEDYAALESWLKDVGAGERTAAHGWGRVMQSLRSGFAFSRLALNLVTVALQPTGIAQSFVVVGKADMARGIVKFASNPSRWANDITAASPFMAERQKTFQRDIHNIIGNLDTSSMTGGRWQKLQRDYIVPLSFYLMQKVQFYTVDAPTWIAAYDQERARGGSEDKARVFADLMVKRAQGSGLLSDRGMLERGKFTPSQEMNEMPKLLTALGSYMFAKFNVAYERTMGTKWSNPMEVMSWAADMALLFALEAALGAVIRGSLPDDEEDPFLWLAKETGLSVMGTIPFVRDAASGLQGFGSGGAQGSVIDLGFARPAIALSSAVADGEFTRKTATSMIDAGGVFFNLPSAQVNRFIKAAFDEDLNPSDASPVDWLGFGQGDGQTIFEYLGSN